MDDSNSKIYIDEYGTIMYYNPKCQIHREDGQAIERLNGDKFWYKEGQLHRLDGPAVEYSNGSKYWYKEGSIHRVDGPACKLVNGAKAWSILDEFLEEKEFNSWISRIRKCI